MFRFLFSSYSVLYLYCKHHEVPVPFDNLLQCFCWFWQFSPEILEKNNYEFTVFSNFLFLNLLEITIFTSYNKRFKEWSGLYFVINWDLFFPAGRSLWPNVCCVGKWGSHLSARTSGDAVVDGWDRGQFTPGGVVLPVWRALQEQVWCRPTQRRSGGFCAGNFQVFCTGYWWTRICSLKEME